MSIVEFPLVSIQILSWNRAHETLRAIESAKQQTYPNIEIVVIDNGSSDQSVKLIKKKFPEIVLIELDKNYGCPGGRNRGVKYCKGDYIFYLDNDGVLHEDGVMNAYLAISSKEKIGIVTGTIYDFKNELEIDSKCDIVSNKRYPFNNFQGGICMHDKKIYDEVGYYPDHFMYGAEEFFMTLKLMDTNYKIIKDESVVLWHKKSDLARNLHEEELKKYFNKLYTVLVLFPLYPMILFFIRFLVIYPYYAFKSKVLKGYLIKIITDLPKTIISGLKNRSPISSKAYKRFSNFQFN